MAADRVAVATARSSPRGAASDATEARRPRWRSRAAPQDLIRRRRPSRSTFRPRPAAAGEQRRAGQCGETDARCRQSCSEPAGSRPWEPRRRRGRPSPRNSAASARSAAHRSPPSSRGSGRSPAPATHPLRAGDGRAGDRARAGSPGHCGTGRRAGRRRRRVARNHRRAVRMESSSARTANAWSSAKPLVPGTHQPAAGLRRRGTPRRQARRRRSRTRVPEPACRAQRCSSERHRPQRGERGAARWRPRATQLWESESRWIGAPWSKSDRRADRGKS